MKDIFWSGDFASNLVAEVFGAVLLASLVAILLRTLRRQRRATRDLLAWSQTVRILSTFFTQVLGHRHTAAAFASLTGNDSNGAWRAADEALVSAGLTWADGLLKPSTALLDKICAAAADVSDELRSHVELFTETLFEDDEWVRYYLGLETWVRTLKDPALMRAGRSSVRVRREDVRCTVGHFARTYSRAASNMHDLVEMHSMHKIRGEVWLPFPGGWRGLVFVLGWSMRRTVSAVGRALKIPRGHSHR